MRVMLMIKGDREPGHLPSEELMADAEGEIEIRQLFEPDELV
jgi:hypothetical protein